MRLKSINVGQLRDNPWDSRVDHTGIVKLPVDGPVTISDPGPDSLGQSGIEGDNLGDVKHHGGRLQAVYAYSVEDYAYFEELLGRSLRPGMFGENFSTEGIDISNVLIGQRIRVGTDVVLEATLPRIPCGTFRGWMEEKGWVKTFTRALRPGTYFQVIEGGSVRPGDEIEVVSRPDHDITIATYFKARQLEHNLLPQIAETPGIPEFISDYIKEKLLAKES